MLRARNSLVNPFHYTGYHCPIPTCCTVECGVYNVQWADAEVSSLCNAYHCFPVSPSAARHPLSSVDLQARPEDWADWSQWVRQDNPPADPCWPREARPRISAAAQADQCGLPGTGAAVLLVSMMSRRCLNQCVRLQSCFEVPHYHRCLQSYEMCDNTCSCLKCSDTLAHHLQLLRNSHRNMAL